MKLQVNSQNDLAPGHRQRATLPRGLEYNYNYTLHTSHYYDVASCDIRRKPYKPLAANSLPVPRCHRALSRAQHVRHRYRENSVDVCVNVAYWFARHLIRGPPRLDVL